MNEPEINSRFEQSIKILEKAVSKSLKLNPKLNRWLSENDLTQDVLLRMVRTCQEVDIVDQNHFIHLMLVQLRRAIIDNYRKLFGTQGWARNVTTQLDTIDPLNLGDNSNDHSITFEELIDFHESVNNLPDHERKVFHMYYYGGLTEMEISVILGISERTVRRRWKNANHKMHKQLGNNPSEDR